MNMENQTFGGYGGEERFYHQEKLKIKPPFWSRHLRQIIAVVIIVLAVVGASTAVIVKVIPHPPKTDGKWQGNFTYYPGRPYIDPFQVTLQIQQHQEKAFEGTLLEPVYGNTLVSVQGTEGDSSQFNQSQLQYVRQLYGNGTGTFVQFNDLTYLQGNQVELNCLYIAVVYADDSLHGVWFYPNRIQPDGTFFLSVA